MPGWTQATIIPRVVLALSVALSGATPVHAGLSAPRPLLDGALPSALLLKVQSVDPGGGDNGGGDNGGNEGGNDGGRDGRNSVDRPDGRQERRITRIDTDRIVKDLYSIRRECSNYDQVYRIDCLRQGIDMVIANIPEHRDYRDARRILRRTSRQLANIVSTYEDRDAPRLVAPSGANPRFKKRRTYRAIKRSALPQAMAKANAVVEEAATQLLRSAENSERRYAHYQQISAAVDSTKTLLRSG